MNRPWKESWQMPPPPPPPLPSPFMCIHLHSAKPGSVRIQLMCFTHHCKRTLPFSFLPSWLIQLHFISPTYLPQHMWHEQRNTLFLVTGWPMFCPDMTFVLTIVNWALKSGWLWHFLKACLLSNKNRQKERWKRYSLQLLFSTGYAGNYCHQISH